MPAEISMPQLSDTMTDGTLVKWHIAEGQPVKENQKIADIETDKAVMEMECFDAGTVAALLVKEGQKVPVGTVLAVVATGKESAAEVKTKYAGGAAKPASAPTPAPRQQVAATRQPPAAATAAKPATAAAPSAPGPKPYFQFDVIVIGGGPAGYAAAIRAGQLKKRTLCIEKENLGGTCLNWGCIPTKALLESAALVRKMRDHAGEYGISFDNLKIDFAKTISRSRGIADKLSKGIAHLLRKYDVKHTPGTGQVVGPNKVRVTHPDGKTEEFTAEDIIVATGARSRPLPGAEFDGKLIISAREAMTLAKQPKTLAIIGAGAIGCEFADFYSAMGTQVTIVEMLDHLLPNEDEDCSILLERIFTKRGIAVHTKTKTDKVEKTKTGVKLTLSNAKGTSIVEADMVLVAVGVTGNVEGLFAPTAQVELFKNHVKVNGHYQTNLPGIWAVGDVIGPPWLAHVAHHEAVKCVEGLAGLHAEPIDYKSIPGCTYTHPQVASMGLTEKKARAEGRQIKVGKFPFSVSGRALAAGETDGFVKLIFDAKYGELLGVHMIGEHVTELLSELVLAKKLEATEEEILEAMHPHPTLSEAVMEAAGAAAGKAIHL